MKSMERDSFFSLVCNYEYKFNCCRIAQIPEVINLIKKSFVSENSEETTESAACTDKESDVNKTLEIMMEPLKVFTFKRSSLLFALYIIFYYLILERIGTFATKGIYV